MALFYKWDVKNDFTYVLTFFSLISDGLGGVASVAIGYILLFDAFSDHSCKQISFHMEGLVKSVKMT